jgi:hypothetical protein
MPTSVNHRTLEVEESTGRLGDARLRDGSGCSYSAGMAGTWWGPARKAAGWIVKTAPAWGPTAKEAAKKTNERRANREKAISHATQIEGQFAEVWLRDRRYWVVRKDGEVINTFPACDDSPALEVAAAQARDEAWKRPDALLRRRPKKWGRKPPKPPQEGKDS